MKPFILVSTLLMSVLSTVYAQSPSVQWDARFGGNGEDNLFSVRQTNDGGYILGGRSTSGISGDRTQTSRGGTDFWIVKTDASGMKQWDARFGGNDLDFLFAVQQTTDGGYILGGWTWSGISSDVTHSPRGDRDYWIVKTDANGLKQWDARFGGSGEDDLLDLQQTSDGGYILGGYSISGISGDKTQSSNGNTDMWIVKTDANGVKQWDATFGGSGSEGFDALQQTSDGGFILGGWTQSPISGDVTKNPRGELDFWMVKTNSSGVKQWDARFGGSGSENIWTVEQTPDGGYILGGSSNSGISGDVTKNPRGGSDYWIVKTNSGGMKQWDARFGGSGDDTQYDLQRTSDGGYVMGGWSTSGLSGDKSQCTQGGIDYWMVKTNSNGTQQWDARFGGNADEKFYSLRQTNDGGYIIGGYSYSGISGNKTQDSRGSADYWVVKLGGLCNCDDGNPFLDESCINGVCQYYRNECIELEYFTLINAADDTPLLELEPNHTINLNLLGTNQLNIRVDAKPGVPIGSVVFELNGVHFRTENVFPFTLAGNNNDDYYPWTPEPGEYEMCVTPYSGKNGTGSPGVRVCIPFTILNMGVLNYTLVNAETDEDIMDFQVDPHQEQEVVVLDLSGLPHPERINIRVNTFPPVVGSVAFGFDGDDYSHIENSAPYALFGDIHGDYKAWQDVLQRPMGGSCFSEGFHHCTVEVKADISNPEVGEFHTSFRFRLKYDDIRVTGYTLMNAVTDEAIFELQDGAVINLSTLPTDKINIQVNTYPEIVGRVGNESIPPYSLFGDRNGDYNIHQLTPGNYHYEAVPYSVPKSGLNYDKGVCGISLPVSFEVIQSGTNKTSPQSIVNDAENKEVQLYPNPNEGVFTVSFPVDATADVKIEVFDLFGKTVFREELLSFSGVYQHYFDLSSQAQGVYFLRVVDGESTTVKKVFLGLR